MKTYTQAEVVAQCYGKRVEYDSEGQLVIPSEIFQADGEKYDPEGGWSGSTGMFQWVDGLIRDEPDPCWKDVIHLDE